MECKGNEIILSKDDMINKEGQVKMGKMNIPKWLHAIFALFGLGGILVAIYLWPSDLSKAEFFALTGIAMSINSLRELWPKMPLKLSFTANIACTLLFIHYVYITIRH